PGDPALLESAVAGAERQTLGVACDALVEVTGGELDIAHATEGLGRLWRNLERLACVGEGLIDRAEVGFCAGPQAVGGGEVGGRELAGLDGLRGLADGVLRPVLEEGGKVLLGGLRRVDGLLRDDQKTRSGVIDRTQI